MQSIPSQIHKKYATANCIQQHAYQGVNVCCDVFSDIHFNVKEHSRMLFKGTYWSILKFHSPFLSRVSVLTRDIDIAILSVCLSVRPSVCPWQAGIGSKRLNISSQFFHYTVAKSFQFYKHQTSSRNSDGVTPCGGAKYRWGIKISDFLPISRYISQTIQDITIVTMDGE